MNSNTRKVLLFIHYCSENGENIGKIYVQRREEGGARLHLLVQRLLLAAALRGLLVLTVADTALVQLIPAGQRQQ